MESLGDSENAIRRTSIFKPSGITWRLGKCDQTKLELVFDPITVFDGHKGGGQEGDQLFLIRNYRKNFRLHQAECAPGLQHLAARDDEVARGRCQEIDFHLRRQHTAIGWH